MYMDHAKEEAAIIHILNSRANEADERCSPLLSLGIRKAG